MILNDFSTFFQSVLCIIDSGTILYEYKFFVEIFFLVIKISFSDMLFDFLWYMFLLGEIHLM